MPIEPVFNLFGKDLVKRWSIPPVVQTMTPLNMESPRLVEGILIIKDSTAQQLEHLFNPSSHW